MASEEKPRIGTVLAFRAKMAFAVLVGLGFGLVWYGLLAMVVGVAAIALMRLLS